MKGSSGLLLRNLIKGTILGKPYYLLYIDRYPVWQLSLSSLITTQPSQDVDQRRECMDLLRDEEAQLHQQMEMCQKRRLRRVAEEAVEEFYVHCYWGSCMFFNCFFLA